MKLPAYITFKHEEDVYIAMTALPNYMARIRRYDNDWLLSQADGAIACPVNGYRILLIFCGTLQGNFVYLGDQVADLQKVVDKMAFWYFINRIDKDPKRYEKWKQG
jgi:hypothetical protein